MIVAVVAVEAGPPVVAVAGFPGAPTSSAAGAEHWSWIVGPQAAAAAQLSFALHPAAGPCRRQLQQHC